MQRLVLVEAGPWLFLATMLRILSFDVGRWAQAVAIGGELVTFVAFIISANRMIEWTGGSTSLGKLSFRQHVALIAATYPLLFKVMSLAAASVGGLAYALGNTDLWNMAPCLMMGFDGIAFDQRMDLGRMWSAILAAVTLLILIERDTGGQVSWRNVIRQVGVHWRALALAVAAVFIFMVGLTHVQGVFRQLTFVVVKSDVSAVYKNLLFVVFVLTFASLRLFVTQAILCLALRASCDAGGSGE